MEKQQVSIEKVLNNTLILMGETIRMRNIKLIKNIEPNLPVIQGNSNQFEQVFINLLQNALGAFDNNIKNGKISIDISMLKDKELVVIIVSDNGVGIKREHLSKIFEPFFTTKEIGKGTGLGLSIVYGIIQEHRGSIECESTINEGTTFRIELPIS
jgi:signal transduction histidine kinase